MDTSVFEVLDVRIHEGGSTVFLELDHGKANEVGSQVLRELEQLTEQLESDDSVSSLITFSRRRSRRGTPIFVAGADVTERGDWDDARVKQHVRWQRRLLARLRRAPVFHAVVVDGVALGWGTEFLLTADWAIAGPGATFALPETGLGILPGAGGTGELWARIGVAQTLRLGMSGERIGAEEAHRIGLVQELVDDLDAGLARATELAGRVGRCSPTAIAAFKRAVLDSVGCPPDARMAYEAAAYEQCVDCGDAAVGRAHFAEIRNGVRPPWGSRGSGRS